MARTPRKGLSAFVSQANAGLGTAPSLEDDLDVLDEAHRAARAQGMQHDRAQAALNRDQEWRVATERKVKRLTHIASAAVDLATAVTCVSAYLGSRTAARQAELLSHTAPIATLARSMQAGELVSMADVSVQQVPTHFAPQASLSSEEAEALLAQPKQLTRPVSANSPLSRDDLVDAGSSDDLTRNLRQGYVALSLQLAAAATLSQLLHVNDRVDVLAADGTGQSSSVVASDCRVLALNQTLVGPPKDGYDLVTLELTPDQATAVAAAQAPRLVAHSLADRQATDSLEGR